MSKIGRKIVGLSKVGNFRCLEGFDDHLPFTDEMDCITGGNVIWQLKLEVWQFGKGAFRRRRCS